MQFRFRIIIVATSLLFATNLISQTNIEIDITKTPSTQNIKEVFRKKELGNLFLVLKGVPDGDVNKITIKGKNFEDQGTIQATKEASKGQLKFTLTGLESYVLQPSETYYEYEISYTGTESSLIAFTGTSKTLTGKIVVVADAPETKVTGSKSAFSPLEIQIAATDFVKRKYDFDDNYSEKSGIYLDGNIVHIFIDQNGNQILTGLPTTSTERYLYQVHLLVDKRSLGAYTYNFSYEGKFSPKFNIMKTSEDVPKANAEEEKSEALAIVEIEMPRIGPFTEDFTVKLDRSELKSGNTIKQSLLNNKINIAKLYHVSISTGLIATTLRNPSNIQKMPLANKGDTTLIADDPNVRGVLTIMATYYPKGRSFLFPPQGGVFDQSRFGIQVGAQLNDKLSENFFLGLSHDFARGGTISYGAHFGRRNYVAGVSKNFKYGHDKFTLPQLNVKSEWQVGFYFGVVIDTRVAIELIKSLAKTN